jgi:hypothetical protein
MWNPEPARIYCDKSSGKKILCRAEATNPTMVPTVILSTNASLTGVLKVRHICFMEGWKGPVQTAIEAVREMYPEARNVLLEEIGKTGSGDWEITISFILPDPGTIENLFGRSSKTYKEFVIDPANNFKSMKIRSVA